MESALFVMLALILAGESKATASDQFASVFDNLRNGALGVRKFQEYLDNEVQYNKLTLSGESLIKEISTILSGKISTALRMVESVKNHAETVYEGLGTMARYFDCCNPPNHVKFTYSDQMNAYVNTDYYCYTGVGARTGTAKHFRQGLLDLMKRNYENNFQAKWQYVGTEDGVLHIYPASRNCFEDYDPRFRPWYVEAVAHTPKDVVLVLDNSGSMAAAYGSQTYMHTAKEAAKTVIDTLNPNDEVGVVKFSSTATIPMVTGVPECFKTTLAQATPNNKKFLKDMISSMRPDGVTQYSKGLNKAFDILSSRLLNSRQNGERDAVILFLTDGRPTDNRVTIMETIHSRNKQLGNKVVIMTFGIGSGATNNDILREMANQTGADVSYGAVRKGVSTFLSDASKLRSSMGTYYDFFHSDKNVVKMGLSVPFFDMFGLGMITSMCSPVVTSQGLRGVACGDLTLSELMGAASFFKPSELSYTFIVDDHGRLMTHPLLPKLFEYTQDPLFVDMLEVEREPQAKDILQSMLSGRRGSLSFTSKRIISRGDSIHDGVNAKTVDSEYHWQNIAGTNYSVCLVVGKQDRRIEYTTYDKMKSFLYHRLDKVQPPYVCNHFKQLASKDESSVKFTPYAFVKPSTYTDKEQNSDTIKKYKDLMLGKSSQYGIFKAGIKETVAITAALEKFWLSPESAEISKKYTIWKSIGTVNGVFRMYPGAPLYKNYDHTTRPWYRKALSAPDRYILTPPYMDAGGSGILMSLAETVFQGSKTTHTANDVVFGVMTIDFTMSRFYRLVTQMFPECASKISCFAMDDSGHLLFHNDLFTLYEKGSLNQVHIIEKEGDIARDLINKRLMVKYRCVDVSNIRENNFWRIEMSTPSVVVNNLNLHYELHSVGGSNIFFVKKMKVPFTTDCVCSKRKFSKGNVTKCFSRECECPCSNEASFNYCTNEFISKGDRAPVCAPDSPPPTDTDPLGHNIAAKLPACFDYKCSQISLKRDCEDIVGCNWCLKSEGGDTLNKPVCAPHAKCPDNENGTNAGLIVGIVVPIIVIVLVVLVVVFIYYNRRRKHPASASGHSAESTGQTASASSGPGVYASAPPVSESKHDSMQTGNPVYHSHSPPVNPAYDNFAYNDGVSPPPYTP